jgi:uncharacterized protein (DUF1501 family)
MKRRNFIQQSALATAGTMMVPGFLKAMHKFRNPHRKLVVVQLSGGNDGLNTIVPYRNDDYYRFRPTINIQASQVLRVSDELGFHPGLASLQTHFDNGNMGILQNVGYPNPDRSHFRSMEIWHTASDSDQHIESGWLGRYLDSSCDRGPGAHLAIEINDVLTHALKGNCVKGMAMRNPKKLYEALHGERMQHMAGQSESMNKGTTGYLYKTLAESVSSSAYIYEKFNIHQSKLSYPQTAFANQMKTIAQMIHSGLETSIYYASLSGFDTHARQKPSQQRLLGIYADGMNAFLKDLKSSGHLSDVLVLTFSEFGRRVKENASGGTDHGTAGNVLLMGEGLRNSGFLNRGPDLKNLDEGDLVHTIDFRRIYATILDEWLGADSSSVLGRDYAKLDFL